MKYRKLTDLKKLDGNPRTIKDKQFRILCDSIRDNPKYFEARPLILSDRTGSLVVIAGNQRYDAAKTIKLKEVPTFLIKGLTEEKEKEIVIRDNINNGEWDVSLLFNDWVSLPLSDWGLDELECLIGDEKEKLEQNEKEIKPYKKLHVLISLDIDMASEVTELMDKLRQIKGIEIEQSAN